MSNKKKGKKSVIIPKKEENIKKNTLTKIVAWTMVIVMVLTSLASGLSMFL